MKTCKDCIYFEPVEGNDELDGWCIFNPRWVDVLKTHRCGQLKEEGHVNNGFIKIPLSIEELSKLDKILDT